MNEWNMTLYAVKHITWDNKVEYWNFFADYWVTSAEFNYDCITSMWTAEEFLDDNEGELVKMKIDVCEVGNE